MLMRFPGGQLLIDFAAFGTFDGIVRVWPNAQMKLRYMHPQTVFGVSLVAAVVTT